MTSGGGPRGRFEAQLPAASHAGSRETRLSAGLPGPGAEPPRSPPRPFWKGLCNLAVFLPLSERSSLDKGTVACL